MSKINFFNTEVEKFFLGESNCKIYLGDTLLYPQDTEPTYDFTFLRQHTNSSYTYSTSASNITYSMARSGTSLSVITGTANPVTAVTIGDYAESIGVSGFSGFSKVEYLTISSKIKKIDNYGFNGFASGTTSGFTLAGGKGITEIGNYAFKNSKIKDAYFPNVTKIGQYAFQYSSGNTITIPSGLTDIGSDTFQYGKYNDLIFEDGFNFSGTGVTYFAANTTITSVTIPNSVTVIPGQCFYVCTGLTSISLPNSIKTIGPSAFYGHSLYLNDLTIPDSVETINEQAFRRSSSVGNHDKTLKIGDGVKTIGASAFTNASFGTIDIGTGITTLQTGACYDTNVKKIIIRATTPPTCYTSAIASSSILEGIYVPCEAVDTYKNANFFKTYASKIFAIPNSCPP